MTSFLLYFFNSQIVIKTLKLVCILWWYCWNLQSPVKWITQVRSCDKDPVQPSELIRFLSWSGDFAFLPQLWFREKKENYISDSYHEIAWKNRLKVGVMSEPDDLENCWFIKFWRNVDLAECNKAHLGFQCRNYLANAWNGLKCGVVMYP